MNTNSPAIIIPAASATTNGSSTNAMVGADIRDIKGPVTIPNGWFWLWVALGVLVAGTGAALLARFLWRKSRARLKPAVIVVPPHVRARNKLREALAFIAQPKPFCTLVSDTLRAYLEERFNFRAPERTTEEFLDELQSSALMSLSQKQSLGDFLVRCDLVKFARYEPGEPELRDLLDAALRLVDETAPPPSPVTANTAEQAVSSKPTTPPSLPPPAIPVAQQR